MTPETRARGKPRFHPSYRSNLPRRTSSSLFPSYSVPSRPSFSLSARFLGSIPHRHRQYRASQRLPSSSFLPRSSESARGSCAPVQRGGKETRIGQRHISAKAAHLMMLLPQRTMVFTWYGNMGVLLTCRRHVPADSIDRRV